MNKEKKRKHIRIKYEEDNSDDDFEELEEETSKKKPGKSVNNNNNNNKKVYNNSNSNNNDDEASSSSSVEPLWKRQLDLIRIHRAKRDAPVDKFGAGSGPHELDRNSKEFRYYTLVCIMLSSQTRDEVTGAAMERLTKHGLTVDNILNTPDAQLQQLIYPVSFYTRKASYIKRMTQILKDKYDGDIPPTLEKLLELPGVGPKMAHIAMDSAWNTVTGIGVDVHVHRVSNRLQWVGREPTKTPEQTRKQLQEFVPRELWSEISTLLVGFGQQVCKPVAPKCGICSLASTCPYDAANNNNNKHKNNNNNNKNKNKVKKEE